VRIHLSILLLLLAGPVRAELPANLQLGSVARDATGRGFAVAVPLEAQVSDVVLETASPSLSVRERGGAAWLVLEPVVPGPVTGRLRVGGTHAVVAGEVRTEATLLLASPRGSHRRAIRLIGQPPAARLELPGATVELSAPDPAGWQDLEVRTHAPEQAGTLLLADGATRIPVQASSAEVVSVLGSLSLPTGVRWTDVIPLRERLGARRLEARLALRGRFQGRRVLTLRDMVSNANGVRFSALGNLFLPPPPEGLPSRALGLRLPDPAVLYLAGADARLIDLRQGIVDVTTFGDRRFLRGAVSPLDPSTVFAVRRNDEGELRLARWSIRYDGGFPRVRPRRLGPPLQRVFDVRDLVLHDLRARRLHPDPPLAPFRERVMLLASPTDAGAQTLQPRLLGLRVDSRQTGLREARVLWKSGPTIPRGGLDPRLSLLPSFRAGDAGYPVGARVDYPDLRYGRRLVRVRPGERFQGRYNVGQRSARFFSLGVPLSPRRHLNVGSDGTNTVLRRFRQGQQEPELGATGFLQGVRPRMARPSRLRERAYLMTEGPGGRALHLLDLGLPAGTNLPPLVDAGPDVFVRSDNFDGVRVRLDARALDPNLDPISFRWIGRGVRFQDATSPRTEAVVPPGVTQVRALARERATKAARYEAVDVRTFTVEVATAAPETPGLRTRLVSLAPNPANPRVRVSFTLARSGPTRVRILDARGRVVRNLLQEPRTLGAHELIWDGEDDTGVAAASGVYFVELTADGTLDTGRVALVR